MLYITRQLKDCFCLDHNGSLLLQWSCFCVDEHPRRQARSLSRGRSESRSVYRHQRSSSTQLRRNFQVFGEEFVEDTTVNAFQWGTPSQPKTVQAGNVLLDVVQTKSGLPLLRVRPKGASDDAFLFSACPRQGFFKLRARSSVGPLILKNNNSISEPDVLPPVSVFMDGRIWSVSSKSGRLSKGLYADKGHPDARVGEEQLIRFKIHHLASKILSHEFTLIPSEETLKSAPPESATSRFRDPDDQAISSTDAIDALYEVSTKLANAPYRSSKQEALDDLTGCFISLKEIFTNGEEAVTPYELSSSGVVSSLLLCLSSSSCIQWRGLVDSPDFRHHLKFLLQRRQLLLNAFKGSIGLPIFIRCLLRSFDQTEHLPVHLFEQIFYPTSSKQLVQEMLTWTDGLNSAKHSRATAIQSVTEPRSCPPDSYSHFDFANHHRQSQEEEYSRVLPIGLIAPPLPFTSNFHNHLTGGGIRGLVDRRVLLLLGAWFPELCVGHCTGSVETPQIQGSCTIVVKRRPDAKRMIRVGKGKGRPLFLSHGFPQSLRFCMIASINHSLRGVTFVKEWHQLPRRSVPFLREFRKNPHHTISLVPAASDYTSQPSKMNDLSMGLFEWMGTCGGTVENWVNPCQCGLAMALLFAPCSPIVAYDGSMCVERSTIELPCLQKVEEEAMENPDSEVLNGKKVGARLTIDVGVQLVPTAYRIDSIRNDTNGIYVRNWCLQASNDGRCWTTLSVDKNFTTASSDTFITIPLDRSNFSPWSKPRCDDTNGLTTAVNVSANSKSEDPIGSNDLPSSFRIFRLMDLTTIHNQFKLVVKGFELFGIVDSVHLSPFQREKLAGMPVSDHTSEPNSSSDCSTPSAASQPSEPSRDAERNIQFSIVDDVYGLPASPLNAKTANAFCLPAEGMDSRALEFAEAIDTLIASNILCDMNEPPTIPENQSPRNKIHPKGTSEGVIVNSEQIKPSDLGLLLPTGGSLVNADAVVDRGVVEAKSGHGFENKDTGVVTATELTPSLPNGSGTSQNKGLTTAELHMQKQMRALRDGRQTNRLDNECSAAKFSLVPGLTPNFDPKAPQMRRSSDTCRLRISPCIMLSPELFYRKEREYDLQMELVARRRDGSVAASVHIDDPNASIFNYILKLAEEIVNSPRDTEIDTEDQLLVQISLEYSLCTLSEERKSNDKNTGQSTCLLTSRDVCLIEAQESQLKRLGVRSPGSGKWSTKEKTEELLELLQLLAKLLADVTGAVINGGKSRSGYATAPYQSASGLDFISFSLTRKLTRQLQDPLAVAAGRALPDWCFNLTQRLTLLFPYDVRHYFFRACALGAARSLLWLQSNAIPSESINEEFNERRQSANYLQRTAATRFATNIFSFLNGAGCDFEVEESPDQLMIDVDRFPRYSGQCSCRQSTIGRSFKKFIVLPRDDVVDPTGCGFWAWAERVMDEHAECESELEIRFTEEEGTGIGPTQEFFSLLSLEFRRKSLGMWLADDSEVLTESNMSSDCINPSFGLFPTPYPRPVVPLNVLRRFYIMGIAVAKAIKDNHLMDLPLSEPFLKLLACYSRSRQAYSSAEEGSLEAELSMAFDVEASRERILLTEDPLFNGRHGIVTKSSRHWLTGLLDFEDFALVQPERANLFRKLLCLHTVHEDLRAAHPFMSNLGIEQRLDEASIAMLGCTVQDLCISMEFISQSETNTAAVRLSDTYSWESPVVDTQEEPPELIRNDNLTVYIRRTLEYCLDKGIRAQMDAFKAGLERVFSMNWLSIFTGIEVGCLISGASGVLWTREELLAYTSPILGYTKSSPTFLLLINVLVAFDAEERREFLRFISGSSSLPVGGLKNLNPRLRIVRKHPSEGLYPSVNTCAHYLKLPEYSTAEELRLYLMTAMRQTGFYLN